MPEPDDGPERELGPRISDALQIKAGASGAPRPQKLVQEARRRVRRRRQTVMAAAATVLVAVSIGGVWNAIGDSDVATSSPEAASAGSAEDSAGKPSGSPPGDVAARATCPSAHAISKAGGEPAIPPGVGLDVAMPVTGLQACRYRVPARGDSGKTLLGAASFNAAVAQQVADAIANLPERNPDLPVFKCAPEVARPAEAIVLRFTTTAGLREVWVGYDGCSSPGFFTGERTYGLYAAPLKLFMVGPVRPAGGTYLDSLPGW